MIEVTDVTVRFGGVVALDGVGVRVEQGQFVAVIGPNGSGKSTLFNAVTGFVTPAAGRVEVDGEDVTALPAHRRVGRGIARTFQTPRVDFASTVRETVLGGYVPTLRSGMLKSLLFAPGVGSEERAIAAGCDDLLERFGLGHLAETPLGELPMGLVRIVEVARAMAMRPTYLLLDEPAAGLSRDEQQMLRHELQRLVAEDVGVLLVEHNFGLVESLSDHVFVLERGELIASGTPAEVASDARVVEAYLGGTDDHVEEGQSA